MIYFTAVQKWLPLTGLSQAPQNLYSEGKIFKCSFYIVRFGYNATGYNIILLIKLIFQYPILTLMI